MISIEPWPSYDDQRRPWWPVRIQDQRGKYDLAWTSSYGGRWACSKELGRLMAVNSRLLRHAEHQVRAVFGSVT